MIPPAGVWCLECLDAKGHRCQAQLYEGPRPLCLPCADGEPCSVDRVGAPAPPVEFEPDAVNDYAPAPVIVRTPEELGLARVLPADPQPEATPPITRQALAEARKLHAAVEQLQKQASRPPWLTVRVVGNGRMDVKVIGGEAVRMSPHAVMGPEILAPEREKGEMEIEAKIRELAGTMVDREIGEKVGVSGSRVGQIRKKLGLPCFMPSNTRGAAKPKKAALALKPGQRAVQLEVSGMAAVDGLLDGHGDTGEAKVRIRVDRELELKDARRLLAKLSAEETGVALSAVFARMLEG